MIVRCLWHQRSDGPPQVLIILIALLACSIPSTAGSSDKGSRRASNVIRIIKAMRTGMTFNDVQRVLPSGTKLSSPHWYEGDQAIGNVARISGTFQGQVIFLSARQARVLRRQGELSSEADHAFNRRDPILAVQIYFGHAGVAGGLHKSPMLNKLSKEFGRPRVQERVIPEGVMASGWCTEWKIRDKATLTVWEHWYGHSGVIIWDTNRL